jgi:hypothetical protein
VAVSMPAMMLSPSVRNIRRISASRWSGWPRNKLHSLRCVVSRPPLCRPRCGVGGHRGRRKRVTAMGRISPFRGEGGQVRSRRNPVATARSDEGPFARPTAATRPWPRTAYVRGPPLAAVAMSWHGRVLWADSSKFLRANGPLTIIQLSGAPRRYCLVGALDFVSSPSWDER